MDNALAARLLPGDRAPSLKLSRFFNRDPLPASFDQPTAVVLWNAGCEGCLPAVGEMAELAASLDMECYGVAVMVRDVDRTAEKAAEGSAKAIMALEKQPEPATGLSRGWVTRHWLEASGQEGVPAAFLVNGHGKIAWMGDPADGLAVLPAIAKGSWDVAAERERWIAKVSADQVAQIRILRDVTDALVSGDVPSSRQLIREYESVMPSLSDDREFCIVKLQSLAAAPALQAEAVEHYAQAAPRFEGDLRAQTSLAGAVVRSFPGNVSALQAVIGQLERVPDGPALTEQDAALRFVCRILQGEAQARAGLDDDALLSVGRAEALWAGPSFPASVTDWARSELKRVRALL